MDAGRPAVRKTVCAVICQNRFQFGRAQNGFCLYQLLDPTSPCGVPGEYSPTAQSTEGRSE